MAKYKKIICKVCGKEFFINSSHLLKHHGTSPKEYYDKYLRKPGEGICPICGKETTFLGLAGGYGKYCSTKCSNSSKDVQNKKKKAYLERYGVENPAQNKKIFEKIKQTKKERYGDTNYNNREKAKKTCLKKYGVEHNWASDNPRLNGTTTRLEKYGTKSIFESEYGKEKIRQTNLEKYGVENPFQSEKIKSKIKQTNLDKYGVEHNMQSSEIKEKRRQNNIEKYGVDSPSKLDIVKEKTKKTNLEKYGVISTLQIPEIKEKSAKTLKKKYGVENISQSKYWKNKVQQTNFDRYGVQYYSQSSEYHKRKLTRFSYNDETFDSSYELCFYKYFLDKGYKIRRNIDFFIYVFDDQRHRYFPDFILDGEYIEIKGKHFFENGKMINPYDRNQDDLYEAKHQCMLKNKVKIITDCSIYLEYCSKEFIENCRLKKDEERD